MNSLRALLFTSLALLALGKWAHGARRDEFPLGYDANNKYYFHRETSFDNSLQVAFDAGWAYYGATLLKPEMYRGADEFKPTTRQLLVGAMLEKNFFKAYASVSAGLSYAMFSTYMFGWPSSQGSGYVVTSSSGEAVTYSLAKNVHTTTSYISLPIEGKYELICEKRFGMYVRGALRTSVKVGTRTRFDTYKEASDETKKLIEDFFRNDGFVFLNANAYLGFRIGSYDDGNFRLELGMPLALTSRVANLDVGMGFGLRISYSIPLSAFTR